MKRIVFYLSLTFAVSWGCWFTVVAMKLNDISKSPFFFLYVLGAFGPLIAAFITKKFFGDKIEFKDFLKQFLRVKVNVVWYLWIILMPLVLIFFPWLINSVITGKENLVVQVPIYMIFAIIPSHVIGGGLEEPGWRGLFLPELLKKWSALTSICIMGITWSIWHLPLWFIKGTSEYGSNFLEFAAFVFALSAVLSILYIKTKSILLCILLHSLMNSYMEVFSTSCTTPLSQVINITALFLIFIILVIFINKQVSKENGNARSIKLKV